MINFDKLDAQLNKGEIVNPIDIFMSLPSKSDKYTYLRNVQAEVLEQWFNNRKQKNNIIKMNTGSGKTTVALLILQSCLNESTGHAAYVVPDNYLVEQVIKEANDLGISVSISESDPDFMRGNSILVMNIYKLFNGKSVFGMRSTNNIELDYILIDDVHACVDDVKAQFRLKISQDTELAEKIFNLYEDDLRLKNPKAFLDICGEDPCSDNIIVPFWRIAETKDTLLSILHHYKDDESIIFNFPLIGDILDFCNCVFTYKGIEIEPYSVPIHKILAFRNAKRRIFMSATLCDDSQLVSTFNINNIKNAITPKQANDIGDRMILFPQAYSNNITDKDIKFKLLAYSKEINIVVIVPSERRAKFWNDVTENIFSAINIKEGINTIKSGNNGLYVLINKYDGIDLPDNACRIIVLDGIPDARTAMEGITENYLQGSDDIIKNKMQKIEQGMGRGVRSNNDFCGVIIMGAQLTQILYSPKAKSFFSIATRKQFEISSIIAQDLKEKSIDEIFSTLDYCIKQEHRWVQVSKRALSDLNYDNQLVISPIQMVLRQAFNLSVLENKFEDAKNIICELVNTTDDPIIKGYLMLEEAKYCNFVNKVDSQRILDSALSYNHHIQKPIKGITHHNSFKKIKPQAQQIFDMLQNIDPNTYTVDFNAVIDVLIFAPNSFKHFESAFARLAELLGWRGERITDGIGPDVLWYLGNLKYAVIECKNEATSKTISKSYCEQLLSSVSWFKAKYESDNKCIPIMIHPSNIFDLSASPAKDFRIINDEKLLLLKKALKDFCSTILKNGNYKKIDQISAALDLFSLTPNKFFEKYTTSFTKQK